MGEKKNVYRHVVLFHFRAGTPEHTVESIEQAFRQLGTTLPFITGFEWGRNSSVENLNDGYTHCFIVSFADEKGRDEYIPHPAHREFISRWLDPHLEKACVLDFHPLD